MTKAFDLDVTTDENALAAQFRLCDSHGNQLAFQQVRLAEHPASRWEGLFDLRRYVKRFAGNVHPLGAGAPLGEAELIRELGLFLGQMVLGNDIMGRLGTPGIDQRTVRVRLPAPNDDHLAAAFARVPWEIARLNENDPTLAERNVLFRAVAGADEPQIDPLELAPHDTLRVLLVFAESPGSRPLAARLERQELLKLFYGQVYPKRRIEIDVLCHGVTRSRLTTQVEDRGGYTIVHWSGHGHLNVLELYPEDGQSNYLTGSQFVKLFSDAGGYVPRLVFLSACHSGNLLHLKDWHAFQAVVEGRDPSDKPDAGKPASGGAAATDDLRQEIIEQPGYTGTAHALLQAGVPCVVAMRYEVGDDYARELAVAFYDRLLADTKPKRPDEALNQARRVLLERARSSTSHGYAACDHATPMLYGLADPKLDISYCSGRTTAPIVRPHQRIKELQPHENFSGRSPELARLGAKWLSTDGGEPVTVIRGLAGMGKTALAAEAIGLWHEQFDWVFCFQAKPAPLQLDQFLIELHTRWLDQQRAYADRVRLYPAEAIWRKPGEDLTGDRRHDTLRDNLVAALKAERVLLVLDNFESCLIPTGNDNLAGHASQDPNWDKLLSALKDGLAGSNSRLLVTSRWPLEALPVGPRVVDLSLGPLPSGEAAVYVRSHPVLRKLFFGRGEAGKALIKRLLECSRGHPLLLDRFARLAEQDAAALEAALSKLQGEGLGGLPDFFATDAYDPKEREYLKNALVDSTDSLLQLVGHEARRALWVLALACEPVTELLWRAVWEGQDFEREPFSVVTSMLAQWDTLSDETRNQLQHLPEELRANLTIPDAGAVPFEPLRQSLLQFGLAIKEQGDSTEQLSTYTCHELVRERIEAWMKHCQAETGGRTRENVFEAYGDRLAFTYQYLATKDHHAAVVAGARAFRYMQRAGQYDKLGTFAGQLVSSISDPVVMRAILPELQEVLITAPPGHWRWRAEACVAIALSSIQPDASMRHFAAAAAEAEQAENWSDLAWINSNLAHALMIKGDLESAIDQHGKSARFMNRAGWPRVEFIHSDLNVLRIGVMQGRASEAIDAIEAHLDKIRNWQQRALAGERVPEAPDVHVLNSVMLSALDISREALAALKQWESALRRIDEIVTAKRLLGYSEQDVARTRFNRCEALVHLRRLSEAKRELEDLLENFEGHSDTVAFANMLGAMAVVYVQADDAPQAIALARRAADLCDMLPGPEERAIAQMTLGTCLSIAGNYVDAADRYLTAMVYCLVTGHSVRLETVAQNYVVDLRLAIRESRSYELPRVADLIAKPEFLALAEWLRDAKADLGQLQQAIDDFVAQCRQRAEQLPEEERP